MVTKVGLKNRKKGLQAKIDKLVSDIQSDESAAAKISELLDSKEEPSGPHKRGYRAGLIRKLVNYHTKVKNDKRALETARRELEDVQKQLDKL